MSSNRWKNGKILLDQIKEIFRNENIFVATDLQDKKIDRFMQITSIFLVNVSCPFIYLFFVIIFL